MSDTRRRIGPPLLSLLRIKLFSFLQADIDMSDINGVDGVEDMMEVIGVIGARGVSGGGGPGGRCSGDVNIGRPASPERR